MSIFGTDGIRSKANIYPMTPDVVMKIASVLGKKAQENQYNTLPRIIIGKDTRRSCYMFESALVAGITAAGVEAILTGPIPTPGISMLTHSLRACYGVMISASHNSFEDNGIKIFNYQGIKLSNQEQEEIEKLITLPNHHFYIESKKIGKAKRLNDIVGRYVEFVKSSIDKNISFNGLKVVLDVANGSAYKIAPQIFEELGAEVCVLNDAPDGKNINHLCGSTDTKMISSTVKKLNYDIGIAFDGDADRVIICDERGEVIDGDYILGAIIKFMFEEKKLNNNKVVLTVMSNYGLEKFLNSIGLEVERVEVGDRNVSYKMREIDANIGGEQSGHVVLSNYSKTGDGILSAIQIVSYLIKNKLKASSILNLFTKLPQSLVNVSCQNIKDFDLNNLNFSKFMQDIQNNIKDGGRIVVRKSGTENVIRVMIEGVDEKQNQIYLKEVVQHLKPM
jgi:phosphoglucosamine mutase